MKDDFRIVEDREDDELQWEGVDLIETEDNNAETFEDELASEGSEVIPEEEDTNELPPADEYTNEAVIVDVLSSEDLVDGEELIPITVTIIPPRTIPSMPTSVQTNIAPNNQATQTQLDNAATFRLCHLFDTTFVEDLRGKPVDEIKVIWQHIILGQEHSLTFTVESGTYDVIQTKTSIYKEFVVPVPRNDVYQFFRIVVYRNSVRFFPVDPGVQTNIEECLGVYFYTEYKQEKGLVLVKGNYDVNVLDEITAKGLTYQFLLYYGNFGHDRTALMHEYMYGSGTFDHMKLIEQLLVLSSHSPQTEMARIRNITPHVRLPIMSAREQPSILVSEQEEEMVDTSATERDNEVANEVVVNSTVEVVDDGLKPEEGVEVVNENLETTSQTVLIENDAKGVSAQEDDVEIRGGDIEARRGLEINTEDNVVNKEVMDNNINAYEQVECYAESGGNNEAVAEVEGNVHYTTGSDGETASNIDEDDNSEVEDDAGSDEEVASNADGENVGSDEETVLNADEDNSEVEDNCGSDEDMASYAEGDDNVGSDEEMASYADVEDIDESKDMVQVDSTSDHKFHGSVKEDDVANGGVTDSSDMPFID